MTQVKVTHHDITHGWPWRPGVGGAAVDPERVKL